MMVSRAAGWTATLIMLATLGLTDAAAAALACPRALAQKIPARAVGAPTGSEFAWRTATMPEREREAAIGAELARGNLPPFLRRLKAVTLQGGLAWGGLARVTICVTPDYLALGSDDDFLRIPMGLATAAAAAERFGFVLPTAKMVDAIYAQADAHLRPVPLPPGPAMRSTAYYWDHQRRIQQQRLALGVPLGALIAGQKKDLVVTNRLWQRPGRVAIYGWHRGAGAPIQPLSTVHGARYADYSHGVRLVSSVAFVDGRPTPLADLLENPWYARLVSDEGPILHLASLIAPRSSLSRQADQDNGCTVTVAC